MTDAVRALAVRAGLLFDDERTERRFRVSFARSVLPQQRTVIALSIAIVVLFAIADLNIDPSRGHPALYVRLFVVAPLLGIMLRLSYLREAESPRHQIYSALLFGGVILALGWMSYLRIPAEGFDPLWPYKTMTWMVIVFALTAAGGLLLAGAALTGLVATLWWLMLLVRTQSPDEFQFFQILFVLFSLLFGCAAAYWLERRARATFLAQEALASEKARVEALLDEAVPADARARLAAGKTPVADSYVEAVVIFADVSGFTALSKRIGAAETVRILDALFRAFDEIVVRHGLEKVKTLGDGYIAIARPRADETHVSADAAAAVRAALDMTATAARIAAERGLPIGLRCGLHLGPVIGGVVGLQRPFYDYWGDALNVASRLQDCAATGEVLCSENVYWRTQGLFPFAPRGACDLHGYGPINAWILRAETSATSG